MKPFLRIALIAVPIVWFAFSRWAAPSGTWPSEHWWGSSGIVTAFCFATYRYLQVRKPSGG
jgi:hypothetical protein